jgi:hypothetical protein
MNRVHTAALVVVAVAASAVGYGTAVLGATTPPPVIETRPVWVTPPSCQEALRLADRKVDAAVRYATVAMRSAPLVADAYKAGQVGRTNPPLLNRVKALNRDASKAWTQVADTTTHTAEVAAAECRAHVINDRSTP